MNPRIILVVLPVLLAGATRGPAQAPVTLVKDGVAQMPIRAGSVQAPVDELKQYLEAMSGARFTVAAGRDAGAGIYVGLVGDFPFVVERADELGKEGFVIRSDGKSVLLLAREPAGVSHAVSTFLQALGCRWFFPGKVWEVVPRLPTVAGSWDQRQTPAFPLQRKIWYGFGASPGGARDLAEWERHNRMGGPIPMSIGHTWHGLDPKTDFAQHPDWFSELGGQRKPVKPCYSSPGVIQRATEHALRLADQGTPMISMTPPDGLGYCECARCLAVCKGGKPYQEFGTTFAKRPDGVLVSVTSETLFHMVNEVAAAVAKKHPQTLIGCYAYSAYSHPPSFKLHPNVFLQTTTSYRRTPLTLPQQLEAFHAIGVRSGIRGYYSVYQWDYDSPVVAKGDLSLPRLVDDLRFYHRNNVQSLNSEASCNWGARGPGYYLASRLLWDVREDPKAVLADFYDRAFGPASLPMERYYVRWLGAGAAVRTKGAVRAAAEGVKVTDELGGAAMETFTPESLRAAYRDLDEAARLVAGQPEYRARVDQIRLYAHYLALRTRLEAAAAAKDKERVRRAVADETIFGARLQGANLVHARPLLGKEFYRRFVKYKEYLEGTPEWPQSQSAAVAKAAGQGFRRPRSDVPDRQELEKLWAEDREVLGIR